MKFVSQKHQGGQRLISNLPFDTTLIRNLELDHGNTFTFTYDIRDLQTHFPINVSRVVVGFRATQDNVFIWATVHPSEDNIYIKNFLDAFGGGYKDISYQIELSDAETKKLLLYALTRQIQQPRRQE